MIDIATTFQDRELSERFQCFQTSALSIDMPDSSVDNIFCMRLLHHITAEADLPRYFGRVLQGYQGHRLSLDVGRG